MWMCFYFEINVFFVVDLNVLCVCIYKKKKGLIFSLFFKTPGPKNFWEKRGGGGKR